MESTVLILVKKFDGGLGVSGKSYMDTIPKLVDSFLHCNGDGHSCKVSFLFSFTCLLK